jgi:hypothetical protein
VLNWSSATERNGAFFNVMNSSDGLHYTKIASVSAVGNSSSINNYSYVVENKKSLGNYYLLKMIDADRSYKNSKSIYVSDDCNLKESEPNIFYNQQSGIVISSTSKDATSYTLNIIDAAGRLVRTESLPIKQGFNNIVVDAELASGVYLVNLFFNNGKLITKKIPVY